MEILSLLSGSEYGSEERDQIIWQQALYAFLSTMERRIRRSRRHSRRVSGTHPRRVCVRGRKAVSWSASGRQTIRKSEYVYTPTSSGSQLMACSVTDWLSRRSVVTVSPHITKKGVLSKAFEPSEVYYDVSASTVLLVVRTMKMCTTISYLSTLR